MTITLAFYRAPTVLGWLIRAATWGDYDHVGFLLRDGRLLSAMPGAGVGYAPPDPRAVVTRFTVEAPAAVIAFAAAQVMKPYDWTGVIGTGLHGDWRAPDSWFCSELVAAAFEACGKPLLRADDLDRVTPALLATSALLMPA